MGGRGSKSGGNQMAVPYDKWGKVIEHQRILDKNGTIIGYIEDSVQYIEVPDIRPITKKEVLQEIDD